MSNPNREIGKEFVGYWQCEDKTEGGPNKVITHKFAILTYDEENDMFWNQTGYIKIDKKTGVRSAVETIPKSLTSGNVIRKQYEFNQNEGYVRMERPTDVVLLTLDQIRKGQNLKSNITIEEVVEEVVEEKLESNQVKIGKQVLTVKNSTHPNIPKSNPHYFFDVHTDDVILDMLESKKVMLVGHTGTGKTSLITEIASRIKHPVIRSNMNGQTTVGDFVGMWTVKAGETVWVDGVLPSAMKEGQWLIIDEIDCADASILAILNSVLEKDGCLTLKEKGNEIIVPHEDFRIFATANAVGAMATFRFLYQGTNPMNEAFLDRFRMYMVNYMPVNEEVKVLQKCVPNLSKEVCQKMVRIANEVRKSFTESQVATTFSTRRLIDWGEMTVRYNGDYVKSAKTIIFSKTNAQDAQVIEGLIKRI